jgi:hypothetical protein
MRLGIILAFLVLFIPFSFATLFDPSTLNVILALTILIMICVLAGIFMLAESISNPQLIAWAKTELRELIVAGLLFVIVSSIFFGADGLLKVFTGKTDILTYSITVLNTLKINTELSYLELMKLMHYITMNSALGLNTSASLIYVSVNFSVSPYSGFSALLGPIMNASQALINTWLGYTGAMILVSYFVEASYIFFPIAFIFRFIPFTRPLGNTLIALVLGCRLLLPFSLVLISAIHDIITMPEPWTVISSGFWSKLSMYYIMPFMLFCSDITMRILLNTNETVFSLITCLPTAWIPGWFYPCTQLMILIYAIIDFIFKTVYFLYFIALGISSYFQTALNLTPGELSGTVTDFLISVNQFVLVSIIDMLIMVIITYTGIRSISAALGGDYLMSAVNKMVR